MHALVAQLMFACVCVCVCVRVCVCERCDDARVHKRTHREIASDIQMSDVCKKSNLYVSVQMDRERRRAR